MIRPALVGFVTGPLLLALYLLGLDGPFWFVLISSIFLMPRKVRR